MQASGNSLWNFLKKFFPLLNALFLYEVTSNKIRINEQRCIHLNSYSSRFWISFHR